MTDPSKKPDQLLGDYDLADVLSLELVESGLMSLKLREALSDPKQRQSVILAVIHTMERLLLPEADRRPLSEEEKKRIEWLLRKYDVVSKAPELVLQKNEHLVYVDYTMPSRATFEAEFPGDVSSSEVFCTSRTNWYWLRHESCINVDRTPGNRIFLMQHFDTEISSGRAIKIMDERGYRPATHVEAYAFAHAYPEAQLQYQIVALGSYGWRQQGREVNYVAVFFYNTRWSHFGYSAFLDNVGSRTSVSVHP